jgi:hypothetical protein
MWPASGGHPRVPPPGPVGDLSKSPADGRGFTGLPCAAGELGGGRVTHQCILGPDPFRQALRP